jgi:CRP/FNR family cyclic AMP-dependent transcriptional regulator
METQFAPGEPIFREREFANRFYFLLEGEVALESQAKGEPGAIESIGAGDVLGWSWLFPPYDWHFSARAVKPTRLIFLYGTWLREHCEQNRDLGYELLKRMAGVMIRRLQATRQRLGAALAAKSEGNEPIKKS